MTSNHITAAAALSLLVFGCTAATSGEGDSRGKERLGKGDSSVEAVFLEFEWDGELTTNYAWNTDSTIESQLLYTIGQLNGNRSVGRLDKVDLTDVRTTSEDGTTRVTYHATMPVAWADRDGVPDSYTFKLPRNMNYVPLNEFAEKYGQSCVDHGAHDVDSGSMWYYYRPERTGCNIDESDIVEFPVAVSPSSIETTGKFPEYHKIWEDNALRVVAIFGKTEAGNTTGAGVNAYNKMNREVRSTLAPYEMVMTPADATQAPGVEHPYVTYSAKLPDGRMVEVAILLIDGVLEAGPEFDVRYGELSGRADLIVYAGHSGLGANIRAMANKGRWLTGQYVIVNMFGCDTYAYVDSALADAHMAVNPDDMTGTRYLDIVTDAMPSYFRSNASNTMAFVTALMANDRPKTFEQIFAGVDAHQVVLVSGEQDNVYVPGYGEDDGDGDDDDGDGDHWEGWIEGGNVVHGATARFATPTLAPGSYLFDMTGTEDADLYVRVGEAPTESLYDCRPYRADSHETCKVELNTAAEIHVLVLGYADESEFELEASKQ